MWSQISVLSIITSVLFLLSFKRSFFQRVFGSLKSVSFKRRQESDKVKDISYVPGPLAIPLFGTKWIYFWQYKMSKIHEMYKDFNKKYGSVVVERASNGLPIVSLFDKDDIEKVLRYPSKYPFRPPTEIIAFYRKSRPDRYASEGLINVQGEEWYHLRAKLTGGITSRKTLLAFLPTLNEICDDFIELIKYKRDENNIVTNFQELANLMGLEAVCCLMLGRRIGYLSKDSVNSKFLELANAVKKLFVLQRDAYYGNGLWKYIPTKTYKDFAKTEDTIYDIISEIVDETINKGEMECQTDDIRSIYLNILASDADIRDKKAGIIDFITAGIETLSHTLSFLFYYLNKDPLHQDLIYKEFSQNSSSTITNEMLSKAHYTKACIQESYRLCPTAFCVARILEDEYEVSGYHLSPGTIVLCQIMIACHKEKNFDNAEEFKPDRWLEYKDNERIMSITASGPGANLVLPFGIGRRTCPGKRYIEMELALVVAKLLCAFKIEFIGELETIFEFLIAPKPPVNVRFIDRDD